MSRTHDHYCHKGNFHWSPFDFDGCPEHGGLECSTYDINYELGEDIRTAIDEYEEWKEANYD
jgi:hypothetical protein